MYRFFFIIYFFAICSLTALAQMGTIKGRVYNARTNEALVEAVVQIQGAAYATVTDSTGQYTLRNVPQGFVHLTSSMLGYSRVFTNEVQVQARQTVFLDIAMTESEVAIGEVEVRADVIEKRAESPLSVKTLGVQQIEKSAGANRDVSKLVQTLPGVGAMSVNRNDLIVRGGGPSENVFFLDGIELPVINHFATQGASGGVVGILNPDFISHIQFYSGAFPANRIHALSSVMDIRMREGSPDRVHTKISVGASDAALTIDGPTGKKGNFIVSARQSYLQLLFKALKLPFLPTYNDFQLKYSYEFSPKYQLSIIGLGSIDNMSLNTGLASNGTETQRYLLQSLPVNEQWHYTVGARLRVLGDMHTDTWVFSRNVLNNRSHKYPNNDENLPKLFDYQSEEAENKLRFERTFWSLPFKLNVGAGVQHTHYQNETSRRRVESRGNTITEDYQSTLHTATYFAFLQGSKELMSQRLKLSFGTNVTGNSFAPKLRNPLRQFSPRLSASYALSDEIDISGNVGRYTRLPAYTTMGFKDAKGEWANRHDQLKYIRSDQAVLGFDFHPSARGGISLEGFYKKYSDYPISVANGVSLASKGAEYEAVGDEAVVSSGKGRAYGIEMMAKVADWHRLDLTAVYTLFRSEFTDLSGTYIPSSWDTRHLLSLMATYKAGRGWNVSARWRLVGGAPYSPIDENRSTLKSTWALRNRAYLDYSRFNTLRLKAAHQLDVRIDKEFLIKGTWVNLYLDLQNAYKSANPAVPIYTNLDKNGLVMEMANDPERQLIRQLPHSKGTILPTMGIIVKF